MQIERKIGSKRAYFSEVPEDRRVERSRSLIAAAGEEQENPDQGRTAVIVAVSPEKISESAASASVIAAAAAG